MAGVASCSLLRESRNRTRQDTSAMLAPLGRCPEHRLPEQRGRGKGAKDTGRARVGTILQYDEKNGIDIIPDGE